MSNFPKIRDDFQKFNKILDQYNIDYLYHFTDKSNIESIIKHGGLYSRDMCKNKGIRFKPSGNDLSHVSDMRKKLTNHIRLSFNDRHLMMFSAMKDERKIDQVILKVNREIIFYENCLFSNMNAADNLSKVGKNFEDFEKINFKIVTSDWTNDKEKKYFKLKY